MEKEYFIKVSFTNRQQPLTRSVTNMKANLDLTKHYFEIVNSAREQYDRWGDQDDFTIDFMIEVPQEN